MIAKSDAILSDLSSIGAKIGQERSTHDKPPVFLSNGLAEQFPCAFALLQEEPDAYLSYCDESIDARLGHPVQVQVLYAGDDVLTKLALNAVGNGAYPPGRPVFLPAADEADRMGPGGPHLAGPPRKR